jgi:beta-lactamase regulating signal transducer with metallopeptidase domain
MEFLYKSSLLLALFYLFYILFLRDETFFKTIRFYFVVGILLSLLLPSIVIPVYRQQEEVFNAVANFDTSNLTDNMLMQASMQDTTTINWTAIIAILYFIGFVVFLLRLIIEFTVIFRLIKKAKKNSVKRIVYAETNAVVSPFSIWNYIVFNKIQFSPKELEQILAHEKVHVSQKHSLDMFLVNIMTLLFWFNPFVWLYKKKLQENLEFLADKYTVSQYNKKEYQYLLLKESIKEYPFALSTNFYQSLIKKRIIMLQKSKSKKTNQLKYLLLIPVLSLFLYSFNTKTIYTEEALKTEKKWDTKFQVKPLKEQKNAGIIITITKNTTDKELISYVSKFVNEGLKFSYSGVKRNANNEIRAIKLSLKNNDGSQSQSFSKSLSEGAISNIFLGFVDGKLFIKTTQSGKITMPKNTDIEATNKGKLIVVKQEETTATAQNNLPDDIIYVLDGKFIKKQEFDNFDKELIKKINVLKGDKALAKYGKKGEFGVIEIYTDDSLKSSEITIVKLDDDNIQTIYETKDNQDSNVTIIADDDYTIITEDKKEQKDLPEALYILNGKEVDKASIDMDKLDIKSIRVYKGQKAVKKFGKGGEKGVIEIITNKEEFKKGWMNYNNATYYYISNLGNYHYYNRYGKEVKDAILLKALNTQEKELKKQQKFEQKPKKTAFVTYKKQQYFYNISVGELTFYDRYGTAITDKKLRKKLLKLL